jgi:exonuclease III
LRLLSWNIDGFRQKQPDTVEQQIDAVLAAEADADVVCLQEVRTRTLDAWATALAQHYPYLETTLHLLGERHNFLLVASRWPLEARPARVFEVPFAELVLSALVDVPRLGPLELTTTHVPNGSGNGFRKIEHLEALYRRLAYDHRPERPRLLCGDFNCPRKELPDGTVITWAYDESGRRLSRVRGQRWDAGERAVLLGLKAFDLTDVYRDQAGYEGVGSEEGSWVARNRGREFPRRFDHVFASHHLRPWQFRFRHDLRTAGLSDHSAVVVDLLSLR